MTRPAPPAIDRRSALFAGMSVALVSTVFGEAAAQDNPNDCAPPGISGKTPVPFKADPALSVRVRKSVFDLSKGEADRLKAAYAALRDLAKSKPDDPRGWLHQGHVHCWYCGGGGNGKDGEEIHNSWRFFPWHRAYMHFHERILCKLLKDDTFALPYWDWDSAGRQTFPGLFGDPADTSNPLFDMLRSAKAGAAMNAQAVSAAVLDRTMNAKVNTLFMGSASASGAMENAPHGSVHVWTGDTGMRDANNDMGVLATAAQDPVFFAHHGNIDRLWGVWLGLSPQHKNFTDAAWLSHTWQFFDENSVWTSITVADVLDNVRSLRSTYEAPRAKPIWTFRGSRVGAAVASNAERSVASVAPLVLSGAQSAPIPIGTVPTTHSILLSEKHARAFARAHSSAAAPTFILQVRGIMVPRDAQTIINLFLDLPDANPSTPLTSRNFVGTVVVLAKSKGMAGHAHGATDASFDVTDALQAINPTGKLTVTLVPMAATGEAPGKSDATYRQVTIEQV